ncbi:hypothetical protein AMATHDRAFT_1641 [Amanita thiersii Skay4041]|uniref:Uncharacterized protein n=1 Tax=Amanita thiersii Skay4041 TaxID=703135 RepID=A0A2A9NWY0_9AGAR|nr:hypothetical protein AMATHDRAFT_1641 [Amanita thiersii Skay4041]
MIPHTVNPYRLPQSFKFVSRADLDVDQSLSTSPMYNSNDVNVISKLNKVLEKALPVATPERETNSIEDTQNLDKSKTINNVVKAANHVVVFRLVSSKPMPLSLVPKPVPPLTEPDCEDTEAAAALRKQRAEAVAVDYSRLLHESKKSSNAPRYPIHNVPLLKANCAIHDLPPFLILSNPRPAQKLRSTVFPTWPIKHSILEVKDVTPIGVNRRHSHRRRRKNKSNLRRTPPTFWRPDTTWRGKCLGYAMGY